VTHPFRKRRFRLILLNSASALRASENRSIITNRKSTMRFPSSHRWTLCITPKSPKAWLKTKIFTFCVAFHIFVAGNRRQFKFGVLVDHIKSQPTGDKMCLKWAWSLSLSHSIFNVWKISDNISKMVQSSIILSVKFEQEVVCALSNGYVADDLGWPLTTLNHFNFNILRCLMHLCIWWSHKDFKFDV